MRLNKRTLALSGLLLLATSARASGPASLIVGIEDRRLEITPDASSEAFDLDQTSLRGTFTWAASEKLTVIAEAAGATNSLSLLEGNLSGPTDTRLRFLYRPTGQWVIGVGAVIPSGLSELEPDELTVTQAIWNPLFGYPLATFAEGPGWEVTLARGFSLGDALNLGLAASYLGHLEFTPAAQATGDYKLGDEINGSAALDWSASAAARLRLLAAYRVFAADQLGGADILKQGPQVDLAANLDLASGPIFASLGGYLTLKDDNEIYDPADPDASVQGSRAAGNYTVGEGRVGVLVHDRVGIYGQARILKISDSDYPIPANGDATSFGPGVRLVLSPSITVDARFSVVSGTGDDDLEFDGTDALITLEFTR